MAFMDSNGSLLDEIGRLKALHDYQILDTQAEKDFDGIVELASQVCDTPIALISLLDDKRQWLKARKGIEFQETDRSLSFCNFTIKEDDVLVVYDTLKHNRFSLHPFVTGDPHFRFYAGMPLIVGSGHKLGALCVMDNRPKDLSPKQIEDLRILAHQVVNLLELRLRNIQLQDLLHNKTSELSHVFDRIGDAFLELDNHWNYIYVNKQLGQLVQRSPESLIGKNVWEEFPQAVGSATYKAFHQAMKEQHYICHLDYYPPLNLWQENHIYPSPDGLCVFIRDISERKTAEERLIKSLENLQRAEEQAKMGSWTFEIESGKRTWSKQLFHMFGFNSSEEPPEISSFLERVHPEDRHILTGSFEKMNTGFEPGETILRTNPAVLPLKYILSYVRKTSNKRGDGTTLFEGIMIDVSELQKTNKELDHFVYSVSHDLRAPLSTILGLINVVEMEQPEEFNHSYYKTIRDQVTRLDSFIRDILDYSFNSRSNVVKDKIDFEAIFQGVTQRVSPFIDHDKLKIEIRRSFDKGILFG
ncbi:MAG: histidine kinase dimerization/phospho-acceptor domain-containing protein [Cyclobacteriaceae bacterium]